MNSHAVRRSLLVILPLLVGCRGDTQQPEADVASAGSYLTAAVRDLLGPNAPVDSLAGPGNCPGHFDISPHQVARLARCKVLFRFDEFQSGFDRKLQQAVDRGLRIVPVKTPGGMCEPDTYLAACRQIADALVTAEMLSRRAADARLAEIETRLKTTAAQVRRRMASSGLSGAAVLAGNHQELFCRFLGLNVVGVFSAADAPAEMNRAVRKGKENAVKLVIGNVPQGRTVPDRFARELNARVVMFENFPSLAPGRERFDAMLLTNLDRLAFNEDRR